MSLLTSTTSEFVSKYTGNKLDECVEVCKKTEFIHDNPGSMSKCRFDGAEGADERV